MGDAKIDSVVKGEYAKCKEKSHESRHLDPSSRSIMVPVSIGGTLPRNELYAIGLAGHLYIRK